MIRAVCTERFFDKQTYYEDRTYNLSDEEVERFKKNGQAKRLMLADGTMLIDAKVVKSAAAAPDLPSALGGYQEKRKELDNARAEMDEAVKKAEVEHKNEPDAVKKANLAVAIIKGKDDIKAMNVEIRKVDREIEILSKG